MNSKANPNVKTNAIHFPFIPPAGLGIGSDLIMMHYLAVTITNGTLTIMLNLTLLPHRILALTQP